MFHQEALSWRLLVSVAILVLSVDANDGVLLNKVRINKFFKQYQLPELSTGTIVVSTSWHGKAVCLAVGVSGVDMNNFNECGSMRAVVPVPLANAKIGDAVSVPLVIAKIGDAAYSFDLDVKKQGKLELTFELVIEAGQVNCTLSCAGKSVKEVWPGIGPGPSYLALTRGEKTSVTWFGVPLRDEDPIAVAQGGSEAVNTWHQFVSANSYAIVVWASLFVLLLISAVFLVKCILTRCRAKDCKIISVRCSRCGVLIEGFANEEYKLYCVCKNETVGEYRGLFDLWQSVGTVNAEELVVYCTQCDEQREDYDFKKTPTWYKQESEGFFDLELPEVKGHVGIFDSLDIGRPDLQPSRHPALDIPLKEGVVC